MMKKIITISILSILIGCQSHSEKFIYSGKLFSEEEVIRADSISFKDNNQEFILTIFLDRKIDQDNYHSETYLYFKENRDSISYGSFNDIEIDRNIMKIVMPKANISLINSKTFNNSAIDTINNNLLAKKFDQSQDALSLLYVRIYSENELYFEQDSLSKKYSALKYLEFRYFDDEIHDRRPDKMYKLVDSSIEGLKALMDSLR